MAAQIKKIIPLSKRKSLSDFTDSEIKTARDTIREHLDNPEKQNTITVNEILSYSSILTLKISVITELVEDELGEIVTLEQRANIERRELVEA